MKELIGFSCAYTPLPLIHASGFVPYKIIPHGDWPEQSGQILHDNICPHVKRILDRLMASDIPPLKGLVFINSCDAMRRLSDAWESIRPNDNKILLDLPVVGDKESIIFFSHELIRFKNELEKWSGKGISDEDILKSIKKYNLLSSIFKKLNATNEGNSLYTTRYDLQKLYNRAVTEPVDDIIDILQDKLREDTLPVIDENSVPIFLFGNVLPDPEVFSFIESCGAHIVSDDLCTGSRMFSEMNINETENIFQKMSENIFLRPKCARTINPQDTESLFKDIIFNVKKAGACGVIAHTVKFCDPYLARMPHIREALQKEGIPFLLIEGDLSLRSIGQQKTRIQAFLEMLR